VAEDSKRLVVTVSDEKLADIHAVAGELSERGLEVDRVLPVTGVITGSLGSGSVEEEAVTELPPPDGPQ
jgi:hypothetical protein